MWGELYVRREAGRGIDRCGVPHGVERVGGKKGFPTNAKRLKQLILISFRVAGATCIECVMLCLLSVLYVLTVRDRMEETLDAFNIFDQDHQEYFIRGAGQRCVGGYRD